MKKKFLSLMMAAAMVATTSVSAFAAGSDQNVEVLDTTGKQTEITVTGKVADSSGKLPPNTINVTVPTSASFTVSSAGTSSGGTVNAPSINIKSDNDEEVEVIAYKFSDPTTSDKITIVGAKSELESADDTDTNKNVYLTLEGKAGSVVLKSTDSTETGLVKLANGQKYNSGDDPLLGTVSKSNPLTLRLIGEVKSDYSAPPKAISENFTLTLKIRKVKSR